MNIRAKLSLMQAVVIFTVFTVTSIIVIGAVSKTIVGRVEMDQYCSVLNLKNTFKAYYKLSIDTYLKGISLTTKSIVTNLYNQYVSSTITEEELYYAILSAFSDIHVGETGSPYLIGYDGQVLVDSIVPKGGNLSSNEFLKSSLSKRSGYIEYSSKEGNKVGYFVDFPELSAIIVVSSYFKEFSSLIDVTAHRGDILSISYGEFGYPYILNYSGELIVHPYMEGENVIDLIDDNGKYFIKEIIKNRSGQIVYPWKDDNGVVSEKLVNYFDIPELGWIIAGGTFHSELYRAMYVVRNDLLKAFVIVGIVLMITLILATGRLRKRIKVIGHHIKNISKGDYTELLEHQGSDEISNLTGDVNHMVGNFNVTMGQIYNSVSKNSEINSVLENGVSVTLGAVKRATLRADEIIRAMTSTEEQVSNVHSIFNELIGGANGIVDSIGKHVKGMEDMSIHVRDSDKIYISRDDLERISVMLYELESVMAFNLSAANITMDISHEYTSLAKKGIKDVVEDIDTILVSSYQVQELSESLGDASKVIFDEIQGFRLHGIH